MQKLGDLQRWTNLKSETKIEFGSKLKSKVRIYVSTPTNTNWFVVSENKSTFFVTTSGLDVIEFSTVGVLQISADKDVMYSSANGQKVHTDDLGGEVFTKIAVRSERNYELEKITQKLSENALRNQQIMFNQMQQQQAFELSKFKEEIVEANNNASDRSDAQVIVPSPENQISEDQGDDLPPPETGEGSGDVRKIGEGDG